MRLEGSAPHNIFLTNGNFIIVVDYTRPVTLTGTPTVAVQVGSVTRRVPLSARDLNNKRFEFRYTCGTVTGIRTASASPPTR